MAERTGIPALDCLLREFAYEAGAEESMDTDGRIDWLRSPLEAEGYCSVISTELAAYLSGRDVDAYDSGRHANLPAAEYADASRNPFYGGAHDAAAFGYQDATRTPDYDQHSLVVIHWQDALFLVDFAAAQYGYGEFPLVQRQAADGSFARVW
jgi:hypothetical protein